MLLVSSRSLASKAKEHKKLGQAQTTAYRQLYANDTEGLALAETKMDELVSRDNKECTDTLRSRTEETRSNPITDQQIQDSLLQRPNPNSGQIAPRSWSPAPSTSTSSNAPRGYGNYRGRGRSQRRGNYGQNTRGYNPNYYNRSRSPNPRNTQRGRSPSRGRSYNNSQSNQYTQPRPQTRGRGRGRGRAYSPNPRPLIPSPEEEALIQMIRSRNYGYNN